MPPELRRVRGFPALSRTTATSLATFESNSFFLASFCEHGYWNIQISQVGPMQRYHVIFGEIRTTVTVDTIISEYLALHLGLAPDSASAHTTVRLWLQSRIDNAPPPKHINLSQWLLSEAVTVIAAQHLRDAQDKWQTDTFLSSLWQ